jgi:hypothetical protein
MDWKDVLKSSAPILTGLLSATGPVGVIAGAGITAIADALGVPADEASIQATVQAGLSPEQRFALAQAEAEVKKSMISAGLEEKRIVADTEKSYILDVEAARAHNANTVGILWLGYGINILSYLLIGALLGGCYFLISGGKLDKADPATLVAVSTLVGAAVQWILSNASQANGFFFGSSPSSRSAQAQVGAAVQNFGAKK